MKIILEGKKAKDYLEFVKEIGYEDIRKIISENNNLMKSLKKEQIKNSKVKSFMRSLDAQTNRFLSMWYEKESKSPEDAIERKLELLKRSLHRCEHYIKYGDFLKIDNENLNRLANEKAKEEILKYKDLCEKDKQLTKQEYLIKLKNYKKTFWRRVFKKIFIKN